MSNGPMSSFNELPKLTVARGVPFVFSTGYNKDSLPNSYQSFPVLQKPFDRLKLGDTLAKLLTPNEPGV